MANVLDILIQAQDMASGVMEKVGETGSKAAGWLEKNWAKVGIATAGAGLALEGMARQQAPLTEQTNKLAASLGMTEEEVRNLVAGLSDVGLPMDEAISLMQAGREQGLKSAEQLSEYTKFWDDVADATGGSAIALADAGAALRAVGVAAGEEGQAVAALGFIHRETSGDINEFLNFVGRAGPELRTMGMDVNDAAAVLGVLEKEFGMTGRVARTEFAQAVQDAEGDMTVLLSTLGITGEQFAAYQQKVAESSGVIAENAAIQGESFTIMQKLQHEAAELTYRYGDLVGVIGNFSPALMAVGPIIKGISAAKTAWTALTVKQTAATTAATAVTWKFNAALLANPKVWIIAAVVAIIAAVVLLIKNWEPVAKFFTDLWNTVRTAFSTGVAAAVGFVTNLWNSVRTAFSTGKTAVMGFITNLWNSVRTAFSTAVTTVTNFVQNLWDGIVRRFNSLVTSVRDIVSGVTEAITAPFRRAGEIVGGITKTIGGFLNRINPFARNSPSLVDNVRLGVRAIQQEYSKLEDLGIPGVAPVFAGASVSPVQRGGKVSPTQVIQGPLFIIENMSVRSDADIAAVSQQLYRQIQAATRARGGR